MRYDVILVGAGSAGSILANRLSEDPNRSVLVLEAGPDYADPATLPKDLKWGGNYLMSAFGPHTWGYVGKTTAEQTQPVPVPRGKVTGGSSTIHGQFFLRGLPEDYDCWASLGNSEWSFEHVLPWFRRMETDLDFDGPLHGSDGPMPVRRLARNAMLPPAQAFYTACLGAGYAESPDHNDPQSTGIGPATANNIDGVRISAATAYLAPARGRSNLTILPNTFCTRVVFDGRHRGRDRARGQTIGGAGQRDRAERRGDRLAASADAVRSGTCRHAKAVRHRGGPGPSPESGST